MELRSVFRNFFFEGAIDLHSTHGGWSAVGEPKRWLRDLITNHPVCAAKEWGLFINGAATPPLKGGEWGRLGTNLIPRSGLGGL
jgi:hypothetical protein